MRAAAALAAVTAGILAICLLLNNRAENENTGENSYYFELSGDGDFYSINFYMRKESGDQENQPFSQSDYIGAISMQEIGGDRPESAADRPEDAAGFELIPGITAYEKGEKTAVWWSDRGWDFEYAGPSAAQDMLAELASAWAVSDIEVSAAGKVEIAGGDRFTFSYSWDQGETRYTYETISTDFDETIRLLNGFQNIDQLWSSLSEHDEDQHGYGLF